MTNYELYEDDFNKLLESGEMLAIALKLEFYPEKIKNEIEKLSKEKADTLLKSLPNFNSKYQTWYTESKSLIKQLIPDRLDDFSRYYERPKTRKHIDYATYTIEDCLLGLKLKDGFGNIIVDRKVGITIFEQQLEILRSVSSRFKSKLYDIQEMVQADFLDNEMDSVQLLAKNKFYRAAGAVCGVVLEKHLSSVCISHTIIVAKKNPSISDFNEQLKLNGVIDVPSWRYIQHLADIRNLCDHNKESEPSKEQIEDLITGVKKIIKTIY